ncbi:MAG: type V CRISPR-associated protein Cas12a/Cpf1 [Candidatus Shapirobacteria bacterium]|nr:type V CRISPR-associated protein Cas12a/Cpf1 [Candidatus Shapirobacteria bacterium]
MNCIYDTFTNLYSLSKTLKFELIPEPATLKILKEKQIIQKDFELNENYQKVKPIFNQIHSEFIEESLGSAVNSQINWNEYFEIYKIGKNEKDKAKLDSLRKEKTLIEKKLRSEITKLFNVTSEKWKSNPEYVDDRGKCLFKKNGPEILAEKGILKLLYIKYQNKSGLELLKSFDSFFTYFSGFNQNRENYYSSDEKSTAISYRIVHENLPKFCENLLDYQNKINQNITIDNLDIFDINYFNECLSQKGINKYNQAIGGFRDESDIASFKVQGINEKINLYFQKTKQKLPKLKFLYKQIGVIQEKKELFFLIDGHDHTLKNTLELCLKESTLYNQRINDLVCSILRAENLDQIYLSKAALNTIQRKYFNNWQVVEDEFINQKLFTKKKNKEEIRLTIPEFISIDKFKFVFNNLSEIDAKDIFKEKYQNLFILKNKFDIFVKIIEQEFSWNYLEFNQSLENKKLFSDSEWNRVTWVLAKTNLEKIINNLSEKPDTEQKNIIKTFLDSSLVLLQMLKYFKIKESGVGIVNWDGDFYNELDNITQSYPLFKWYDAVRNYLTRKPFSEDKIKVNFEKGNLLGGWPDSPEGNTQYGGFIFRKNNNYFLGISQDARLFDLTKNPNSHNNDGSFEKMDLKQLDGKTIYGSIYGGKYQTKYAKDKDNISNYELIKRVKDILKEKSTYFPQLNQIIDGDFDDPKKLATEISSKTLYSIDFFKVSENYINEVTSRTNKPLYLFKISNKYLKNSNQNNKNNLHTKFFLKLFEKQNNESLFKLCGGGEIFFRKASVDQKIDESRKTSIKIVKNKRYTEDKYFFHVPIALNATKPGYYKDFNKRINEDLIGNKNNVHIIGIDRGEKHLAYYSVINQKGEIVEQGSLNKDLLGKDYGEKLEFIAKEREKARENWDQINKIKDLKDGYISQVTKRISDLVIKHNGIVVFEDLNSGFKRGRQKIEKSVYQKLELALIKKLNYLVDKNKHDGETLSVTNALQLTPPTDNFGEIKGKQWGIIFYTTAAYTSVTDPITGFRKNIYLKKSAKNIMRENILKLDNIIFDQNNLCFRFDYSLNKFQKDTSNKKWSCYTHVDRICNEYDKKINKWVPTSICLTEKLNDLFKSENIDINKNIIEQIKNKENLNNKFYEDLTFYINLLFQLRNSNSSKEIDFIYSPIEPFFDSRKYQQEGQNLDFTEKAKLPVHGDSNGAYNIARKGLIMFKRIKLTPDKPDLFIGNEYWDCVAQNWEEFIRS